MVNSKNCTGNVHLKFDLKQIWKKHIFFDWINRIRIEEWIRIQNELNAGSESGFTALF
jgi:hypothetical protein